MDNHQFYEIYLNSGGLPDLRKNGENFIDTFRSLASTHCKNKKDHDTLNKFCSKLRDIYEYTKCWYQQ